jgi:putative Mg2+ transporter-C (MgtC) family protein
MFDFHLSQALYALLPSLVCALGAGGLIGLERSSEGHAAGFRTFSLVALGSALLTAPTVYPELWHYLPQENLPPMDPTRVIQGIVTGVGFLGAGVIFKEGFSVRGLTTAACLWVVSAIGVLMGLGLFDVGILVTAMVLAVLTLFRRVESLVPSPVYRRLTLRYRRDAAPDEDKTRAYLQTFGLRVRSMSYRLCAETGLLEHAMSVVAPNRKSLPQLAQALSESKNVVGFELLDYRE